MPALPKNRLGGLGLPSWLPDWLTGKDVRPYQGPPYIPPRGTKGGYRKEMAWDVARGYTDPWKQRNVASGVMAGADLIPVVGDVTGVEETVEDWREGKYIPAIAGGLGTAIAVVPGLEGLGKAVKEGGRKLAKGLGGPSKELDEIVAAGEAAAKQPKVEPVQTSMALKTPYDVLSKDDWVRFDKAHKTGEGIVEAELPIGSLNAPHDINPDFASAAARYGGGAEAKPLVIKKGGRYYVADGVHRLVAAEKAGRETANVRLVDLDTSGVDPAAPQGLGASTLSAVKPTLEEFTTMAGRGQIRQAKTPQADLNAVLKGKVAATDFDIDAAHPFGRKYEEGTLTEQLEDAGLVVDDDKMGRVIAGRTQADVDALKNAKTPTDYGRIYGYSDDDIAAFYLKRRGGDPNLAYEEFVKDLPKVEKTASAVVDPAAPQGLGGKRKSRKP